MKIAAKLKHRPSREVHKGHWFEQIQLIAIVIDLTIHTLKLHFINLAAEFVGQDIQRAKTAIVSGFFIFTTRISQTHDQPAFVLFKTHKKLCSLSISLQYYTISFCEKQGKFLICHEIMFEISLVKYVYL